MKQFLSEADSNWKNKEKIQDLMKGILASGHKIAIVSYNDYPDAVKYAIEQLLGKEIADKIHIKPALPSYDYNEIQRSNKVPYIQEVMKNTGITNKENVFFMDDDSKHVVAANEFGIKAVLVEKYGSKYINKAWKFFEEFNETHGIFSDTKETPLSPFEKIEFDPVFQDWADEGRKIVGDYYKIN